MARVYSERNAFLFVALSEYTKPVTYAPDARLVRAHQIVLS